MKSWTKKFGPALFLLLLIAVVYALKVSKNYYFLPAPLYFVAEHYAYFVGTLSTLLFLHLFVVTKNKREKWEKFQRKTFGEIHWEKPLWFHKLVQKVLARIKQFFSDLKDPKKAIKTLALSLSVVSLVVISYLSWPYVQEKVSKAFHKDEVGLRVETPYKTHYYLDAKGRPAHKIYPLSLQFAAPVAPIELIGKDIKNGPSLFPDIKGSWKWENDRDLIFTPEENWNIGKKYKVTLSNKFKLTRGIVPSKAEHSFTIDGFTAIFQETQFYEDPVDPLKKKVVTTLSFNHPVDLSSLKDSLKVLFLEAKKNQGKKDVMIERPLKFEVILDELKLKASIHTEQLSVPELQSHVKIILRPGLRSEWPSEPIREEKFTTIKVPGLFDYFNFSQPEMAYVDNKQGEPEQILILQSSAIVARKDVLSNLAVHLLPRTYGQSEEDFNWQYNQEKITPAILESSTLMALEEIPAEREEGTFHSFKINAPAGRFIYVQLTKGLKSSGGYVLSSDHNVTVKVPEFPTKIKINHEGSILSMSGEKKLGLVSQNVPELVLEIGQVLPNQVHHVVEQNNASVANPSFGHYKFNEANLAHFERKNIVIENFKPEKANHTTIDLSPYWGKVFQSGKGKGLFFVKVYDKKNNYQNDKRFIMLTDLGIVAKESLSGEWDVFVANLRSGRPAASVTVQVLGKNGEPLFSKSTDSNGRVHFPKLPIYDYKELNNAVAFVAKDGDDLAFVKIYDYGQETNYSQFNVGGTTNPLRPEDLRAYVFTDRGLYRPGEKVHLASIVKTAQLDSPTQGLPLEMEIIDSRGNVFKNQKFQVGMHGLDDFTQDLPEVAPTGTYSVSLYLPKDPKIKRHYRQLIGSGTFKVQEFLPDRMKVNVALSQVKDKGWLKPDGLKGIVTVSNLFGTPAEGRQVQPTLFLNPFMPDFSEWKDYRFFAPERVKLSETHTEELGNQRTNDKGEVEVTLPLEKFSNYAFWIRLQVEAFEPEGGRSVLADTRALVSPLDYMIGYKADGDLAFIHRNSDRAIHLISVNSDLKKVATEGLKLRLSEKRFVSVLIKQSNGTYKYESRPKNYELSTTAFSINKDGTTYKIPTKDPGDFLLEILGPNKDEVLQQIEFSVAGSGNLARSLDKNAELVLKLDKKDYRPGEPISIQIKAPYAGSGLITIEREKVFAAKWFKTSTDSTVESIILPPDLEGNAYINVAFVRSLDSKEVYMSPFSFGVVPFSVDREKRINPITLKAPALVKPGEAMSVYFKTKNPSKIILYAVDEGILQVARYQNPAPLDYFLEKRALQVRTWQILDLLLPEQSILRSLMAPGGDMADGLGALSRHLNPFRRKAQKPVAFWSGPLDAGPREQEVLVQIPDYFNGTLRLMAVAVGPTTIGTQKDKVISRGDIILSPNVPTFVSPGDEFVVSVGVSNNIDNGQADSSAAHSIEVTLNPSKKLEIMGPKNQTLELQVGREKTATFKLKARDQLGEAQLSFEARSGIKKTVLKNTLSNRPAQPHGTTIQAGHVKDGRKKLELKRDLYEEFAQRGLTLSPYPLALVDSLIIFLQKSPYGCTEQLLSMSFPYIVLKDRPEFAQSFKDVNSPFEEAIHILRARLRNDGSLSLFGGNSQTPQFITLYGAHFLIEARDHEFPVPEEMLLTIQRRLQKMASGEGDLRSQSYAIYLLTRLGQVTSPYIQKLRPQLESKNSALNKQDLAFAYLASSYALMKDDKNAAELMKKMKLGEVNTSTQEIWGDYYSRVGRDTQLLYLLSLHFPEQAQQLPLEKTMDIFSPIIKGGYNTLNSSYAIMAMDAYSKVIINPKLRDISAHELLASKQTRELNLSDGNIRQAKVSSEAREVWVENKEKAPLFYSLSVSGFDRNSPKRPLSEGLEIYKEIKNAQGNVTAKVNLGDEYFVHLKVRSTQGHSQQNVAIVDLLPGGHELVIEKNENVNGFSVGTVDSTLNPQFVEGREDRVVIYADVGTDLQTFVYKIKATNRGTFVFPGAMCEAMYDRQKRAQTPAQSIEVVGQ